MARVKNNRRGVFSIGAWVVLPGETGILPDAEWATFKRGPIAEAMLGEGELIEVEAVSEEATPDQAATKEPKKGSK
jgi:hypothetical protein